MPEDALRELRLSERLFWQLGLGIEGRVFDSREEFEKAVDKDKLDAKEDIERMIIAWEVESEWRDAELFVRYGHAMRLEFDGGCLPWPRFIAYGCNFCHKIIGGMPEIRAPRAETGKQFLEFYCVHCGAYIGGH